MRLLYHNLRRIKPKNDFVRSGLIELARSALGQAGIYSHVWSNTAIKYGAGIWDANAYILYINTMNAYPSNGGARYQGFPVRCLVY